MKWESIIVMFIIWQNQTARHALSTPPLRDLECFILQCMLLNMTKERCFIIGIKIIDLTDFG